MNLYGKASPTIKLLFQSAEQVRYLDLTARRFAKLTSTHCFDITDISDADRQGTIMRINVDSTTGEEQKYGISPVQGLEYNHSMENTAYG